MSRTARLFLACLALSAACGVRQKPGTGAAQIHVTLPGGSAGSEASQVTTVAIVVTGGPLLQPLQSVLQQNGAIYTGTISGLAVASNYTFEARALDASGNLLYDGDATPVPIAAGVTTAVSIIAQEVNPSPGPTEVPPSITAIIASTNNPVEGAGVSMTATVSAPATSQLTYAWTATYASAVGTNQAGDVAGTFTSGQDALTASWTAPEQVSTINMGFCVNDATGAEDCAGFTITVSLDQNGSASVTVTLNDPPVITTMTSSQYRMQIGQTITLTGAATTDTQTSLSYSWSTGSCNGGFVSANNSTPASSAPAAVAMFTLGNNPPTLTSCPFTFTVTDGLHASTSGTLTITIGPNATTTFWPQITSVAQDANADFNGAPVGFSVVAVDINDPALPLTYTWTAQNMAFVSSAQADPTNCPTCTSATYTPAACSSGPASATVTVNNGIASNTYTFNVQNCAPTSCQAIHAADPGGLSGDGVYWIDPAQGQSSAYSGPFQVYCDMTRHGGGWQLVATYGPDRSDKNLNIDQSIGAELLSPAYSAVTGGFIEGYSMARFQAYGSNYAVRSSIQAANTSGALTQEYAFWQPTLGSCDTYCAGTYWCSSAAAVDAFQFLFMSDTTGLSNTTWLNVADYWNGNLCSTGNYVGTTFGYNNANSNGVNCLDSNGQTQACSTPPGWVIAPYSGGITGECNAAADCMLDGVTTAGGVPGEVWIKAALISGTP